MGAHAKLENVCPLLTEKWCVKCSVKNTQFIVATTNCIPLWWDTHKWYQTIDCQLKNSARIISMIAVK